MAYYIKHIFGVFFALILAITYCNGSTTQDNFETAHNERDIGARIVGGKVVNIIQYPHQISLRMRYINGKAQKPFMHSCGGSLYSERIVITAAHCLFSRVKEELMVVAGANERASADGAITAVQEIIMHEQYNETTYYNDIGLLVLATALPINNFTIKPVELTEAQPQHGDIATITGWGLLSPGGAFSDYLREVKVPVVGNEICNQRYEGAITDAMLCAGLLDVGGKDACQMDSGGPLLVNGKLAGVVSWGNGCGLPEFPGVYANVWYLSPWLRETIAKVEAKLALQN